MDLSHLASQNFVFYLKLTAKLTNHYVVMAHRLRQLGITLVAINPQDLFSFEEKSKRYVVCMVPDLHSQTNYLKYKKRYLDFATNAARMVQFHISSFGNPHARYNNSSKGASCYYHFALPISIDRACKEIALVYYRDRITEQSWPGGKRPKLPSGILPKE